MCIGPNPARRAPRAGAASGWRRSLRARVGCRLYVEAPGQRILRERPRRSWRRIFSSLRQLGAQTVTLCGPQRRGTRCWPTRAPHNATKIVIGKPTHPRWRDKIFGLDARPARAGPGDVDVYIITGDVEGSGRDSHRSRGRPAPAVEYARAAIAPAVCARRGLCVLSLICLVTGRRHGVPARASPLLRRAMAAGPSIFAVVPVHRVCSTSSSCRRCFTFAVSDANYLLTFAVMFAIALIMSTLTAADPGAGEDGARAGAEYAARCMDEPRAGGDPRRARYRRHRRAARARHFRGSGAISRARRDGSPARPGGHAPPIRSTTRNRA